MLLSEITRRSLGSPSRRQATDLATVASWPASDADTVEAPVRRVLRVTDMFARDEDGLQGPAHRL